MIADQLDILINFLETMKSGSLRDEQEPFCSHDTDVETGEMLNMENSDRRGWLGFDSASPVIIQL